MHIEKGNEISMSINNEVEKKKKIKGLFIRRCRYWQSISTQQDFFWWKDYKYIIGYLHNNHKLKPLYIMIPKTSTYVKRHDGQTKWMHFDWKWCL